MTKKQKREAAISAQFEAVSKMILETFKTSRAVARAEDFDAWRIAHKIDGDAKDALWKAFYRLRRNAINNKFTTETA